MPLPNEICQYYEYLETRSVNSQNTWQEIIDNALPTKGDIRIQRAPGSKKTSLIFDSTGQFGIQLLANFIQGSVTNQATKWFSQRHRREDVNRDVNVASWIEGATVQMLLSMRQSNFYKSNGEAITDWVGFGNGALLIEDVPQKKLGLPRIRYTALPIGRYVMSEGPEGKMDFLIRKVSIPARQAVDLFPDVSIEVKKLAEKQAFEPVEFLHGICPREFFEGRKGYLNGRASMPYASYWIEKERKKIVKEGGYRRFPVAIARWDVISGEIWARGPGEVALPDIKTLNRADEMAQIAWGRELDPPVKVKQGSILSTINLKPGGQTVVKNITDSVAPMYEGTRWDTATLMRDDKRQNVLRVFHVNEILNLLSRERPQEMTASEWLGRLQLLQEMIGPVFGRAEIEYLKTIIDVTFDNLFYQGLFDEVPPELAEVGGPIDVVFEGPLARAQRNQEITAYQQYVTDIIQLSQLDPDVLHIPDVTKLARTLAEIRGVQNVLNSEEYVEEMVQKLNAQKAMAATLATGSQVAEGLGKAAPALKLLRENAQLATAA